MTYPKPPPEHCHHTWRAEHLTHTCWEPPGHPGPHRCRLGNCADNPTTTEE